MQNPLNVSVYPKRTTFVILSVYVLNSFSNVVFILSWFDYCNRINVFFMTCLCDDAFITCSNFLRLLTICVKKRKLSRSFSLDYAFMWVFKTPDFFLFSCSYCWKCRWLVLNVFIDREIIIQRVSKKFSIRNGNCIFQLEQWIH